ncbi:MAG: cyclic lactone autoinducer peptide [Bacillota bacterium]
MIRTLKLGLTKENLLALVLGGIALLATFIAQSSSNTCLAWTMEQPKIPKSLIKAD